MREPKSKMAPARRRRIALASTALVLGLALALPLGSYALHWLGFEAVAEVGPAAPGADGAGPAIAPRGDIEAGVNPRSNYWRAVGAGVTGESTVKGPAAGILVQPAAYYWQEFRESTVARWLPWAIVAMAAVLLLYHLVFGRNRLDKPLSGRKIKRWGWFDRLVHWTVATTFVALAVTGLSMLIGRELLIPLLGHEGFATWASASITVHNVAGPVFSVGIALMIVMWVWVNFPQKADWVWLKMGGGMFKQGTHPPAGRMNAGEKLWFWLLATGGVAVVLSGLWLVAPSWGWQVPTFLQGAAGDPRTLTMQANLVHAGIGVLWTAAALGHIYIGTAGTEGAFEGMATGYVSAEWAEQHHDLWYEKMAAEGRVLEPVTDGGAGRRTLPGDGAGQATLPDRSAGAATG